ncbi:hypothetical protein QQ045_011291 [Rhodiola kirilowii]
MPIYTSNEIGNKIWQINHDVLNFNVGLSRPANDAVVATTNAVTAVPAVLPVDESISEFIVQVSNLIKLVNSKDIVELHMKQLDCELLLRKKEALLQPATLPPLPSYIMQAPTPSPPANQTRPPSTSQSTTSTALVPAPASAPAAKPGKPSLPPLKYHGWNILQKSRAWGTCICEGDFTLRFLLIDNADIL